MMAGNMDFIFLWQEQYLTCEAAEHTSGAAEHTSEAAELGSRYPQKMIRSSHEKKKSTSPSYFVIFFLLYRRECSEHILQVNPRPYNTF